MPDVQTQNKGQVSRAEFEALDARNQELEMIIREMGAQIHDLNRAQLAGVGVDPALAARQKQGRTIVQFRREYNRMAQPSSVKDGPNLIEAYSVTRFGVVAIRNDELERIVGEWPDLVETEQSKFVDFPRRKMIPATDEQGRPGWRFVPDPIGVKTLIATAQPVG